MLFRSTPTYVQAVTSVSAAGAAGSVSMGQRLVAITGCQAMGQVGNVGVFYWSLIDDSETANWQNIDDSQTPGWATLDDSQSANWQNVGNAQSPSWGLIDDSEAETWNLIST